MRVRVVRTGGVAAIRRSGEIDTTALPPAEARWIEQILDGARFFGPHGGDPKGRPDAFVYAVTVEEDGGRVRTVRWAEDALPEALRPLVERVLGGRPPQEGGKSVRGGP